MVEPLDDVLKRKVLGLDMYLEKCFEKGSYRVQHFKGEGDERFYCACSLECPYKGESERHLSLCIKYENK